MEVILLSKSVFSIIFGHFPDIFCHITLYFCIFGSYAAAMTFGTFLYTVDDASLRLSAGDIMTAFFGILIGAFSIGQSLANFQFFVEASAAAGRVYSIIDRQSKIDPLDKKSLPDRKSKSENSASIEFRNVKFRYPGRKEVEVLKGLNLKIENGKRVALVGVSGGGKSTHSVKKTSQKVEFSIGGFGS